MYHALYHEPIHGCPVVCLWFHLEIAGGSWYNSLYKSTHTLCILDEKREFSAANSSYGIINLEFWTHTKVGIIQCLSNTLITSIELPVMCTMIIFRRFIGRKIRWHCKFRGCGTDPGESELTTQMFVFIHCHSWSWWWWIWLYHRHHVWIHTIGGFEFRSVFFTAEFSYDNK